MTTKIVDSRDEAIAIGYKATDWHEPIAYGQYLAIAAEWDVKAVVKDGEVIGATYFKHGEIHVSILPEWRKRWLTKGLLREILKNATMTRVTPGHEYMFNILKRLGFVDQGMGTFIREN